MLQVDYRDGSKELKEPLREMGLPVTAPDEKDDLDSGDLAWVGRGVGGASLLVGIEYKKLGELMQSLRSNRMNEQARRMFRDYQMRYLLIEGEIDIDDRGRLTRRSGWRLRKPLPGPSAGEVFKRVEVLRLEYGLCPIYMPTRRTVLKQIEFLYRLWTDQDQDKHKSHLGVYEAARFSEPSQFERTIRTLPECGMKFAKAAESQFGSIRRAINANAAEWAQLESKDDQGKARRFGMSNASKLVDALTKEEE